VLTFTKKRLWIVIAIALVVFFLWEALGSSNANASQLEAPQFTSKTVQIHGATVTTWTMSGLAVCPQYPGGRLAGWVIDAKGYGPWPGHPLHWTFGPWSGSFCSNGSRLWSVNWGGKPSGNAPFPGWVFVPTDTQMLFNDNVGTQRSRKWGGHAYIALGPVSQHQYPWLNVRIGLNASVVPTSFCDC